MSTAKVIQIIANSDKSFEDAVDRGVAHAAKSLRGLSGVEVVKWTADVENAKVTNHKVTLNVAFKLDESS